MIKRNIENGENSSEKVQIFKGKNLIEHFEILTNTLNHALVGVTTFYITWYAFTVGFVEYQTFHAWFSTIAYQLFMTEGILALYNNNSITMAIHKKAYKIRIHLVLQIAAFSFALFGISYQIYNRQITGRNHFHNTHGITGLVSGITLVLSTLSGFPALFSIEIRRYVQPFFSKAVHNILALTCYSSGMIALISAYYTRSWLVKADPGEIRFIMMWCLSFILAITVIGSLKTTFNQLKNK